MQRTIWLMAAILACLAPAGGLVAQQAPALDKKADPAFEAARAAFEALPEVERRAVQAALVWTGDFNSVDSGVFGRRSYDAIVAYQRRAKAEPTGMLDAPARAALLAAGQRLRDAAGFVVRVDQATGATIGVPAKLLPRTSSVPHGTRWQSPDARITLETRSIDPSDGDLAATFDRLSAATADRKITYKLKRPDFFVVSGETASGRFFTRMAQTPAGARGFTLAYDKASAAAMDKVVIAVANSFVPSSTTTVADAEAPTPTLPTGSLSAFAVAPGRLLTSATALGACATPRIGANPVHVVTAGPTLALLETTSRRMDGISVGPAPDAGAALVVVANAPAGASVAPAEALAEGRLTAPLQPGAAGAPALDRSGRLVGLVARFPAAPKLVAGVAPSAGYDLVTAAAIRDFLSTAGVPLVSRADAQLTAGEIAAMAAPRLETITCGG